MAAGKTKKIGGKIFFMLSTGLSIELRILPMRIPGTIKAPDGILKGLTKKTSGLPIDPVNKSRREFRLRIQGRSKFLKESKKLSKGLGGIPGNTEHKLKKTGQRVKTICAKDMEGSGKVITRLGSGGKI
ncbi:hypothetical protein X943_002741 [Babesia divergens]|uniref:Uncharacterized protein n=1 Tax=Babesia divergens TaxID=32595 RepID=A0AAD9GKN9_BABDI|nr:hypothetical protein X943_002741 [Babesia divergens]